MNTNTQDTPQPASATRPDCAPPIGSASDCCVLSIYAAGEKMRRLMGYLPPSSTVAAQAASEWDTASKSIRHLVSCLSELVAAERTHVDEGDAVTADRLRNAIDEAERTLAALGMPNATHQPESANLSA